MEYKGFIDSQTEDLGRRRHRSILSGAGKKGASGGQFSRRRGVQSNGTLVRREMVGRTDGPSNNAGLEKEFAMLE